MISQSITLATTPRRLPYPLQNGLRLSWYIGVTFKPVCQMHSGKKNDGVCQRPSLVQFVINTVISFVKLFHPPLHIIQLLPCYIRLPPLDVGCSIHYFAWELDDHCSFLLHIYNDTIPEKRRLLCQLCNKNYSILSCKSITFDKELRKVDRNYSQ